MRVFFCACAGCKGAAVQHPWDLGMLVSLANHAPHADCGDLNVPSADVGTEFHWDSMYSNWNQNTYH